MQNRDIYVKDPLANRLINNGVAEVSEDRSKAALDVLRYELETFVCDGQYAKGLQRIFETFLSKLGTAPEQPAVWISGFYGSGKSHLAKMLRALWVDVQFDDGTSARSIIKVPDAIREHLRDLTTQGKRYGGLHAAPESSALARGTTSASRCSESCSSRPACRRSTTRPGSLCG
jgi:hypothetical protein